MNRGARGNAAGKQWLWDGGNNGNAVSWWKNNGHAGNDNSDTDDGDFITLFHVFRFQNRQYQQNNGHKIKLKYQD